TEKPVDRGRRRSPCPKLGEGERPCARLGNTGASIGGEHRRGLSVVLQLAKETCVGYQTVLERLSQAISCYLRGDTLACNNAKREGPLPYPEPQVGRTHLHQIHRCGIWRSCRGRKSGPGLRASRRRLCLA